MKNNLGTFESFMSDRNPMGLWSLFSNKQMCEYANLYASEVRRKTVEEAIQRVSEFKTKPLSRQAQFQNQVIKEVIEHLQTLTTNSLGEGK